VKAFVVEAPGTFGVRDDVQTLPMGPGDVRVKMRAAGICRTDLSVIHGDWPTAMPCVDGHEGAGIVVEVGDDVNGPVVGNHVVIGARMCGRCYYCVRGAPWYCVTKDLGSAQPRFRLADGTPLSAMVGKGTWAEELVVPQDMAVVIAEDVPLQVASLIGCAVATGVGQVLNVGRPEAGSSALILGGGGIGACTVMGAALAGCTPIVVVDPATSKHETLLGLGASHAVRPEDLPGAVAELTAGRGFDAAFENVGRPETIRAAVDATRVGGTVVFTGLGGRSGTVTFDLNELSAGGRHLIGNFSGGLVPPRDLPRYCELYSRGFLALDTLISRRLVLDDLPRALRALEDEPGLLRQVIEFT
jgi:S-(hydroxymethyl)glutathione dehydrogenase/alcohol dehydrogenase